MSKNCGFVKFLQDAARISRARRILITGTDPNICREAVLVLLTRLKKSGPLLVNDLGRDRIATGHELEELLAEDMLLSGRRAVVLWQADTLVDCWQRLSAECDSNVICYAVTSDKVEYKGADCDYVIVCDEIKSGSKGIEKYAAYCAEQHGKTLTPAALQLIHAFYGENILGIANEMLKCSLLVGSRPEIDRDDIIAASHAQHSKRVFDLVDAMMTRDLSGSMRIWEQARRGGASVKFILNLLAKRLQLFDDTNAALSRGENMIDFMKRRKLPHPLQTSMRKIISRRSAHDIPHLVEMLCEAQSRIKWTDDRSSINLMDKTIFLTCNG